MTKSSSSSGCGVRNKWSYKRTSAGIACADGAAAAAEVLIAIRPEFIHLAPAAEVADGVEGVIAVKTFAGNLTKIIVTVSDGSEIHVEDRPQKDIGEPGDRVTLSWAEDDAILLTR